jgi:sphingomyelin phosphodiesterase
MNRNPLLRFLSLINVFQNPSEKHSGIAISKKSLKTFLFFFIFLLTQPAFAQVDSVKSVTIQGDCCHLKILTWNVQMLPDIVKRCYNREERCKGIIHDLENTDYDVIVFQEVFSQQAYHLLYEGLKKEYPYQSGMPLKNHFLFAPNGVLIISRLPFKIVDYTFFNNCKGADFFSCKGALLIEAEKNGRRFQLVATHLQADNKDKDRKIRQQEYAEIYERLLKPYACDNVPQFIAGDMNTPSIDSSGYHSMIRTYQCVDGNLSGDLKYTYDGKNNPLVIHADRSLQHQLDYILIRNNCCPLDYEKRQIVKFQYQWNPTLTDLSDHYALEGEFELGN